MSVIDVDEIRSLADYEEVRDDLRRRIIALKKYRRLNLGDRISMVFENRETMLWQVHEMMRAERIADRSALKHECETYSRLLPTPTELSATLYIEISQSREIRPWLDRLVGIDLHTQMVLGDDVVSAYFDPSQYTDDRIAAVHYLRFRFTTEQRERFFNPSVEVRVEINHPHYTATAPVAGETRRSLVGDLRTG